MLNTLNPSNLLNVLIVDDDEGLRFFRPRNASANGAIHNF